MRRRQRTLVETLARSLTAAGVIYALVVVYALPVGILGQEADGRLHLGPGHSDATSPGEPTWQRAHAARFPDCVDIARWASAQVPSTVVVVEGDGKLRRMSFEEAYRRATSSTADDDHVWMVGACG